MNVAGIPPSRIVVLNSLWVAAVAISLATHFSNQSPPVAFAGLTIVASFMDVATLTGTYRIGGIVPVLGPLNLIPRLFSFFLHRISAQYMAQ